jgi:hypothetical protein
MRWFVASIPSLHLSGLRSNDTCSSPLLLIWGSSAVCFLERESETCGSQEPEKSSQDCRDLNSSFFSSARA